MNSQFGRKLYLAANGVILFFMLAPLAIVAVFAVNPTPYIDFPPVGFSLKWFEKLAANTDLMQGLWLSLRVALVVVCISTVLGAAAALAIARGNLPNAQWLSALFLAPLTLPAILTGFALFQASIAFGQGRPLWVLVAGHVLVTVPYVIRTTLAVLADFDTRLEEAAASLGATPIQVFWEVTLPLIRPGVIAGAVFAFIVSFDQFPVSLFLVAPGNETLPVVLFNYMKFDLDGTVAAASMVSIALAVAVVIVLDKSIGLRASVRL